MLPGTATDVLGAPGEGDGEGVVVPEAVGVGVGVGVEDACSNDCRSTSCRARFVFFGVGWIVEPGVAEGGAADGLAAGAGTPLATASTWRNCSRAVSSSAASLARETPGADTTMLVLPWVLIVAPPTPAASTRCRMMLTAWSRAPLVTLLPCSGVAVRMTCVPPLRSRPSFGLCDGPRNSPRYRATS